MRYEVGDKVIVRKDLQVGTRYDDVLFFRGMKRYRGRKATVYKVLPHNMYLLVFDNGYYLSEYWSGKMVVPGKNSDILNIMIKSSKKCKL